MEATWARLKEPGCRCGLECRPTIRRPRAKTVQLARLVRGGIVVVGVKLGNAQRQGIGPHVVYGEFYERDGELERQVSRGQHLDVICLPRDCSECDCRNRVKDDKDGCDPLTAVYTWL